jgi:hypothetical protein
MARRAFIVGTLWTTLLLGCTGPDVGEPGDGTTAVSGSALTYVDSLERAHCERLFECPRPTQAELGERMMAGTVEQCILNQQASRQTEPDRKALIEGIRSGELTLNRLAAEACLSALSSCELASTNVGGDTQSLYCRLALKGRALPGESCQTDLQCEGDSYCGGGCPGTCQPRHALGQECESDNQCAGLEQLVTCQAASLRAAPVCVALPMGSVAQEGEACVPWEFGAGNVVPCARGLWCSVVDFESAAGICTAAILPGGDCEHDQDVCSGTGLCGEGRCTDEGPRGPGEDCDAWPHLCDVRQGLACENGTCRSLAHGDETTLGCEGSGCSGDYCGGVDLVSEPE